MNTKESIEKNDSFNTKSFYFFKSFFNTINKLWHKSISKYFLAVLIVSIVGLALYIIKPHIGYQSVSLAFLFTISLLPLLNFRPGPIFLAAVISASIWNFFFIPPQFTFRIDRIEDVMMFGMYFVIASVSGLLISRIRTQQLLLNQKEKRTASLYNLAHALLSAKNLEDVAESSVKQLKETFHTEVVFIFAENENSLTKTLHPLSTVTIDDAEWNVAQMSFLSKEKMGKNAKTLPNISHITYLPLSTKQRNLGIVGLIFPPNIDLDLETESLLDTFLAQISIAVEREYLKESAKKSLIIEESEKLYKTLFDSISHELKTPITTILGAITSLNDEKILENKIILKKLINETNIAGERLNRLVENLLDITRIESGNLILKKDWYSIDDLFNLLISKIKKENHEYEISIDISEGSEIFRFDYTLIEQALLNILRNEVEYTPAGSKIEITVRKTFEGMMITISDNGKGFPKEEIKNLFKKFYRIPGTKAGGTGLGLSIAKGFIEAHGGTITVRNKKSGGAEFIILLPFE